MIHTLVHAAHLWTISLLFKNVFPVMCLANKFWEIFCCVKHCYIPSQNTAIISAANLQISRMKKETKNNENDKLPRNADEGSKIRTEMF